ncbi:type II toxin-antitoxin system Phd/YefM family antitoxin [Thiococcus pfennigii]|uniref:type II toxin-antitoxin system Phd/YefM family antitoxin n=1 Tax=Thiococcus pfennigii TaxID=1057 RepID=UPI0019055CFE|nr:type II toxin-antitoxin system prevent-host-death family antitoxin [Thiococcus pfennigii]MBK1702749.1 prevent-host-death protein [Thiococcus pfennigii]
MREVVSIREANQHLSRYLERVEQGAEIIITRRGKAIARLLPIEAQPHLSDAQRAARERLRERMTRGYALGGARVDREVLHERNRGQEPDR